VIVNTCDPASSPRRVGNDFRNETGEAAMARADGLPYDAEEIIETALRERELAWSVRRLLSRQISPLPL
jgi:hypothetical protein